MLRGARIRDRAVIRYGESEFLVLGANAELRVRLKPASSHATSSSRSLDRGHVDLITGHAEFRRRKGRRC